MSVMQYVNISTGVICCAVCVILLICAITSEYHNRKLNRIFVSVLSVTIALILVDISIFTLEGRTGESAIFRTAYFLSFILGSALLILFTFYFLALIDMKTTAAKKVSLASYTAIALCAVNVLLIILTQFFGLYYRIGENNSFQYGDYYIVSQILAISCMLLNTGVIFAHRRIFEKRELVFLLSYITLPLLSIFVHNMIEDTIASIDVATTLTILIFYAGVQSELSKKLKEKELELTQSRIDIMLSQIQPHFLYNTLATIEAFCNKDNSKTAARLVRDFSAYLRENMESLTQKEPVHFDRELAHVKIYLDIEKARLREKLTIVYNLEITDFYIPILVIQPLVENAVRYGVSKKRYGGTITISTRLVPEGVKIIVSDDGAGFDSVNPKQQDGRSHIGIANVRERLRTQCGGILTIKSEKGKGTECTIIIPQGGV